MKVRNFRDSTLARGLFWAVLVFAFVMAVLPHPPRVPGDPSDKIQHIAAFATLGALGALAYASASTLRLIVGLSVFGALIEIVQAVPMLHRDSDPLDWVADTVACGTVLIALAWWRRRSADTT